MNIHHFKLRKMEKIKKLEEFILDNDLWFVGDASEMNSDCCVISGFALSIGADITDIENAIDNVRYDADDYGDELTRVFNYASVNGYEHFWKTPMAKKQYTF